MAKVQSSSFSAVARPKAGAATANTLAMLIPIAFLLVLFVYPVGRLLLLSVEGGTFVHFHKAFSQGLYLYVFWNTVKIAFWVTLASFALGYPVAHFLANTTAGWAVLGFAFVMLPFWTSLLVRTYAWMVLLGNNGVINRLLVGVGLVDSPLPLLHNTTGVLIGMVHVLLPYFIFPVYGVMRRIDRNLIVAAEGLGASSWQAFRTVYFPLTLPGVAAGAALVFILSLGFFITPALLGGGRVVMIAVLIEQEVREFLNWGFAGALCLILLVLTLAIYSGMNRLLKGDIGWH